MVQSGFPVPPLHVRCAPLLVENAPELLALKESAPSCPVMFRISSRPHAPAVPSAPSTQARKGAPLFENFIGLKGFSPSLRPFRNWVLGQSADAGAWREDKLRVITGDFCSADEGDTGTERADINSVSGAFFIKPGTGTYNAGITLYADRARIAFDTSLLGSNYAGTETVPQHTWQPIILYLGRPK